LYDIGLQQEQPLLYDSLTKVLEPVDQQLLQSVIQEAEIRSMAAQQAQEQLASMDQSAINGSQHSPTRINA
jgi:importin-7